MNWDKIKEFLDTLTYPLYYLDFETKEKSLFLEKTEERRAIWLVNYDEKYVSELNDEIYKDWYSEAPFFIKNQVLELRTFIKKYITKKSSDGHDKAAAEAAFYPKTR